MKKIKQIKNRTDINTEKQKQIKNRTDMKTPNRSPLPLQAHSKKIEMFF